MASRSAPAPDRALRRPRLKQRLGVAALVLVALLVWTGRTHQAGPASGRALNDSHKARPATRPILRVATFNIHAGDDSRDPATLADIANALRGFDVIGLNEVLGQRPFHDHRHTALLGEALDLPHLFAPAEREYWCDHFGNALLCRLPVRSWGRTPLSGSLRRQPKSIVSAEVELGGALLTVLITHLDHARDQGNQLQEAAALFHAAQGPAILMGDLNLQPSDSPMRELLAVPGVIDAVGTILRGRAPANRVDWILCKGIRVLNSGMVDTGASDHPLVWAELSLDPSIEQNANNHDE